MDYYVTVPAIGLSMLGTYALALSRYRIVAGLVACAYLAFSIRDIRAQDQFRLGRSEKIHNLLLQLQAVQPTFPARRFCSTESRQKFLLPDSIAESTTIH